MAEDMTAYVFRREGEIVYAQTQAGLGLVHATDFYDAEEYAYKNGVDFEVIDASLAHELMEQAVEDGCEGIVHVSDKGSAWYAFEDAEMYAQLAEQKKWKQKQSGDDENETDGKGIKGLGEPWQ